MFKASSLLLLLTLVLNAQLGSPAPISAKVIQPPGPETEKPAPVLEDHSHFIEEKEPLQEKLIPVVAGEALPEESPAEEDIPVIAEEPEPIFIEDQVPEKAAESQEVSPPQEPLTVESLEEKTVSEEVAVVESSPDETTEEVAASIDVESEQHDVEDPAPILVIPIDDSEGGAPEKNAEEKTAVDEEIEPLQQPELEDPAPEAPIVPVAASEDEALKENTEEEPAVDVETEPQEQPDLEDPSPEAPIVPVAASEDEALKENTEEEPAVDVETEPQEQPDLEDPAPEAPIVPVVALEEKAAEPASEEPVLIVPDDNPVEKPAAVPMTPHEEQSVVLDPAELETEEAGEAESGPEEHAIIVAVEPAVSSCSCQRKQKETVLIVSEETKEEEAPVEEVVAPLILEENAEAEPANEEEPLPDTLEEEEPVVPVPVELETDEEGQAEPQQSDPEEPVAVAPAEEEPEQEETVLINSSDSKEEEVSEEHVTEDEAVVPIVLEEDNEADPATNEEPLPGTSEEEDSVALVPVDLETEEESQVKPAAEEESVLDDPVIVPLDPAREESELEEQVSPEATDEKSPEEYTEEEAAVVAIPVVPVEEDAVTNEEEPLPGEPEEEESVVLDTEEEESVVLDTEEDQTTGETEQALENPAVIVVVEPTSEEPSPEDPILIIPLEDLGEDVPEDIRGEEEVVQSDPLPEETVMDQDRTGDSDAEVPVLNVSENDTTEKVLGPDVEVPAAATEILTEVNEPVTAPALTEAEVVAAPLEGVHGTGLKTHRKDFQHKAALTEEEPVAPMNRGAVLGVAFFTLMSFIVFGFVWTTISKKLR